MDLIDGREVIVTTLLSIAHGWGSTNQEITAGTVERIIS